MPPRVHRVPRSVVFYSGVGLEIEATDYLTGSVIGVITITIGIPEAG